VAILYMILYLIRSDARHVQAFMSFFHIRTPSTNTCLSSSKTVCHLPLCGNILFICLTLSFVGYLFSNAPHRISGIFGIISLMSFMSCFLLYKDYFLFVNVLYEFDFSKYRCMKLNSAFFSLEESATSWLMSIKSVSCISGTSSSSFCWFSSYSILERIFTLSSSIFRHSSRHIPKSSFSNYEQFVNGISFFKFMYLIQKTLEKS